MGDDGRTTFQLWHTTSGHAFFEEGNEAARALVGLEGRLVWSVRARSWDEARRRMHAFLGWPPYRPTQSAWTEPSAHARTIDRATRGRQ